MSHLPYPWEKEGSWTWRGAGDERVQRLFRILELAHDAFDVIILFLFTGSRRKSPIHAEQGCI